MRKKRKSMKINWCEWIIDFSPVSADGLQHVSKKGKCMCGGEREREKIPSVII